MISKFNINILSYNQFVNIIRPTFVYLCEINKFYSSIKNKSLELLKTITKDENENYIIDSDDDKPDRPMTEDEIEDNLIHRSGLSSPSSSSSSTDPPSRKRRKLSSQNNDSQMFEIQIINNDHNDSMSYKSLMDKKFQKYISDTIKKKFLKSNSLMIDVLTSIFENIIIIHDPECLIPVVKNNFKNSKISFIIYCLRLNPIEIKVMDHTLTVYKYQCVHIRDINFNNIISIHFVNSNSQFNNICSVRDLSVDMNPRSWEIQAREISWLDYRELYKKFQLLNHGHIVRLSRLEPSIVDDLSDIIDKNPISMLFPLYSIHTNDVFCKKIVQSICYITRDCRDSVGWFNYVSWSQKQGICKYMSRQNFSMLNVSNIHTCQKWMKLYNHGTDIRNFILGPMDEYSKRIMCPVVRIYDIVKNFLKSCDIYTFRSDPDISYIDICCHSIVDKMSVNFQRPMIVMSQKLSIPKKSWFRHDDHGDTLLNFMKIFQTSWDQNSLTNIHYRLIITNLTDDIMLINTLLYIFKKLRPKFPIVIECMYIKDIEAEIVRNTSLVARGFCWRMFFENCFPKFIDYGLTIIPHIQKRIYVGDIVYIPDLNIVSKVTEVYRRLYDDPSIIDSVRLEKKPVLLPKIKNRYITNGHRYEYIQLDCNNSRIISNHNYCCGIIYNCKNKIILSSYNHCLLKININ